jgi:putative DNA primase/helicase
MNKTNNSIFYDDKNRTETQENLKIVLSCGYGKNNNKLTEFSYNYNELRAKFQGFTEVKALYNDKIIVNGQEITLLVDDAIKQSLKAAKDESEWFIAGVFDGDIRRKENLKYRSAVVLDLDNYDGDISTLELSIKEELASYTYLAYSTASHTPSKPKVRIFIPTTANIMTAEYDGVARSFVSKLSFKSAIDAASFKANQFMYFSNTIKIQGLPEGVKQPEYHKWFLENEAELLNPQEFKPAAISNEGTIKNTGALTSKQKQSPTLNLSEKEVIEKLEEYPASRVSYDEWLEVLMALHHYYKGSDKGLSIADEWSRHDIEKYKSFEEIKYKWRSFSKESNTGQLTFLTVLKRIKDRRLEAFEKEVLFAISEFTEKVKDDMLMPVIKNIAEQCSDQEAEYYLALIKAKTSLRITSIRALLSKVRREIEVEEFKNRTNTVIYPLDKKLPPMMFDEYIESKPPKATIENFKTLINAYGIKIVRNVVSKRDRIILPGDKYLDETADASRLVRIESLITANNFGGNKRIGPDLCTEEASLNPYNPISEWVMSKSWDGIDRLQAMYDTVVTPDHYQKEHKELFLRKWFISFIAAMEEPKGVFSKGVLIFQGEQSIGKTSWFKKLLPPPIDEYFLEGATLDPTSKDSIARVTSHAIVELGEADSTMKKDVAAIKAFLTSNKDVFRPSYGRVDNRLPRRTVFCASVNDHEYLVDPTGNSRFWTIPVESINYKHDIDMQQFWAQIRTYYKAGEIWWLQQDEEQILNTCNEDHIKTCPYTELLFERFIFPDIEDNDPKNEWLGATQIYRALDMKAQERVGAVEVARILKKHNVRYRKNKKKFLVQENPNYKPPQKSSLFGDDNDTATVPSNRLPC